MSESSMDNYNQGSSLRGLAVTAGSVGGIGCAVPLLVVLAIFVGRQLDEWLGTAPWLLLGLVLSSIVLGVGMMISSALAAARAAHRDYLASKPKAGNMSDHPRGGFWEES